MEVSGDTYYVLFDEGKSNVSFQGEIRLPMPSYEPIRQMLSKAFADSEELTIDIGSLRYLNSSGITMIFTHIIKAKHEGKPKIKIIGNNNYSWQTLTLEGFKKAWEDIEIDYEE